MESRESSSPMVTHAVAHGLQGKYADAYEITFLQKLALRAVGYLPQEVAYWLMPRAQSPAALEAGEVSKLHVDDLISARLQDYAELERKVPVITVGIALGGTTAHLSLAMDAIFLPQAFVMTLKNGSMDGNVQRYFDLGAPVASSIIKNNPELMTIQHYDPVHDGWLTRRVNHLRVKLIDLPKAYKDFLRKRLEPGGAVVYLNGGASWLRYRVGERSVFQVGGWGGIAAHEFLEGSERLTRYCVQERITQTDWKLPGFPLEQGAESEWGSEPGLGKALQQFCQEEGFRFVQIALPEPDDYSRLAFLAYKELIERDGGKPKGVLIEMFSQFDATAVIKGSLLPLWLVFNTQDSLAFLKRMLPEFPDGCPLFFSPLATFSKTPDLVSWEQWSQAFKGRQLINIGARPNHFPADTRAVADWNKPLRNWVAHNPAPIESRMGAEELLSLWDGLSR